MERKNNYYTPKIEEFYSGFEYEYLLTGSKNGKDAYEWIKSNEFSNDYPYNANPHYEVQRRCDIEEVRVKYLDREDIESFGFIECGQEEYEFIGHTDLWVIKKLYHENIKNFYRINNKDNCQIMFIQIKNKSELKKLLIQLGIYETTTK